VRVSVPAAAHERMIVRIPTVLRSYTGGRETVEIAAPATLGLRFRIIDEQHAIRPHIKLFVDGALLRDLAAPIPEALELMIVGALSGG
jgi:sulfur-carrier protein